MVLTLAVFSNVLMLLRERVHKVGRLWAAVLLSADAALGSSIAKAELAYLVGSHAARLLIDTAIKSWPVLWPQSAEFDASSNAAAARYTITDPN
jgi:hypothetical protein